MNPYSSKAINDLILHYTISIFNSNSYKISTRMDLYVSLQDSPDLRSDTLLLVHLLFPAFFRCHSL